ncbi:MAG: hypothetical protein RLZZ272_596 [Actinomycetota bacterium]
MQLTADRHWGTWLASSPSALVHLPSGLGLRVSTYSAREGRYEAHVGAATVTHHEHGGTIRLRLAQAGSVVEVRARREGVDALAVSVRLVESGEWALRFWTHVEVGRLAPPTAPRITEGPMGEHRVRMRRLAEGVGAEDLVEVDWRSTHLAVLADPPAARAGRYADEHGLPEELERGGYYLPHADVGDERAALAILRFSGQEQSHVRLGVAIATDAGRALERAREALEVERRREVLDPSAESVPDDGVVDAHGARARDAIRDVIGWNTVWDHANGRPMTALTREWLAGKFGGYGVWLDDVAYAAFLAALGGDDAIARANLTTVTAGEAPAGNLPCLLTSFEEWVDRSQPPVVSWMLLRTHLRRGAPGLVRELLPALRRNHAWWWRTRDPHGDGLVAHGSSPTGRGTFRHTKQGALNEASMDNLPLFDEARFDPGAAVIDLHDPGLNAVLVLDAQMLARLCREVGDHDGADELDAAADAHAERVRERLWDADRGAFVGRRRDGSWNAHLTATSFLPLVAGIATADQARQLVERHLLDEGTFWGPRPLPASSHADPASADRVYWRGRIWAPHVWLVWEGLVRHRLDDVADELATRAWEMFAEGWSERRCYENLDPRGPEHDGGPDADPFYTWGALLALPRALARADANPWRGTLLDARDGDVALEVPGGRFELRQQGDGCVLRHGAPGREPEEVARLGASRRVEGLLAAGPALALRAPADRDLVVEPVGEVVAVRIDEGRWEPGPVGGLTLPAGARLEMVRGGSWRADRADGT